MSQYLHTFNIRQWGYFKTHCTANIGCPEIGISQSLFLSFPLVQQKLERKKDSLFYWLKSEQAAMKKTETTLTYKIEFKLLFIWMINNKLEKTRQRNVYLLISRMAQLLKTVFFLLANSGVLEVLEEDIESFRRFGSCVFYHFRLQKIGLH